VYDDPADLATYGVTVIDLTKTTSGDRPNHAKFADNPMLVKLLGKTARAIAHAGRGSAARWPRWAEPRQAVGAWPIIV
jgi:esterase/lipase superfamily enzyme